MNEEANREIVRAISAGLSPAVAIDHHLVEVWGVRPSTVALLRNKTIRNIHQNLTKTDELLAARQIESVEYKNNDTPDCQIIRLVGQGLHPTAAVTYHLVSNLDMSPAEVAMLRGTSITAAARAYEDAREFLGEPEDE